ncbi:hypothetical protein HN51_003320 [Arachis hypogaea]|uniref:LOB domain-containing protein n=1 Tax=Arachis hypogaea TaxID=3818 RepID=A0A445EJ37_ARAHY|nr:LOB domain-containing protein 27-like [Arachis hypogaea]QHO51691.1 LOB domain-containing protein [Arachis hypogaea]RYR75475.1 hypothetical protein Ahy_A01g000013 [Arachis hypogaea]
MTLKGGTTQACAACKFQRRKCTPECLLAPYFPADQPKVFLNVHKLFGVSNIVKILKDVDPSQKKNAMESIIVQASYRDKYPVRGCVEEICRLQNQIWLHEEELHAVYQQLEMCRQHQQQQHQGIHHVVPDDLASQLEVGMAPRAANNALPLFNHAPQPQQQQQQVYNTSVAALPVSQQHSYSNSNSVDYNSLYIESKENNNNGTNPLWVPYANNNGSPIAMQSQMVTSQALSMHQEAAGDYDEMHPFFETIDDRQSYIYSKEAYESSSEESLKDSRKCTEHVAENELKSAAACFSLTSVN